MSKIIRATITGIFFIYFVPKTKMQRLNYERFWSTSKLIPNRLRYYVWRIWDEEIKSIYPNIGSWVLKDKVDKAFRKTEV